MKKAILATLMLTMTSLSTFGATTSFTGGVGGTETNWNVETNWDNGLPRYEGGNVNASIGDGFDVVVTADYTWDHATEGTGKYDIYVGDGGTSSLTVSTGTTLSSGSNKDIFIGNKNVGDGYGTINVEGTLIAGDEMRIGQVNSTAVGILNVANGATLTATATAVQLYRGEIHIGSTANVSIGQKLRLYSKNDTYEGELNMTTDGTAIGTIDGLGTLDVEFDNKATLVLTHAGAENVGDSWTVMENVENFYAYNTTTAGGHFAYIKTQDNDPGDAQSRIYSADYTDDGSVVVTLVAKDSGGVNYTINHDVVYQGGHTTMLPDNINLINGAEMTVKEGTLILDGKVARIGENSGGGTLILQGGRITSDGQFASFNIGNGSNYGTVILEGGTLDLQDNVNIKNGFLHIKDGVTVTDNNGNFIVLDPSTVKFDINTSLGANPEDALSEWTSNGNDMKLESGSTLDLDFLNGADTGTVFTLFSGVQNIWDDDNFAGEFGMVDVTGLELDQSIVMTYTAESAGGAADGTITATVVPEPATMSLLALGGMAMLRRRKK
ncbi:MAG: PEP-CTERM sorting domain-containing protein [Phycisphaerales bacterium]|jgi:hypothetical protein|nr:PEP-CTERM sorting domain-containing protein [Phycisphaerales bacterium]MBT7171771.1 PEP-CTERM sorting domain-containing protein [Phycisphaerales bacterium]